MLENLKWYLRWKFYLLRKDFFHSIRSPKTFLFFFVMLMGLSFLYGTRRQFELAFIVLMVYYLWVDYSRGIPKKWKYEQMIKNYNKRNQNGEHNSTSGERNT